MTKRIAANTAGSVGTRYYFVKEVSVYLIAARDHRIRVRVLVNLVAVAPLRRQTSLDV